MTDLLSRRDLNRATLARQFLLERVDLSPLQAIEQLAGMQAQAPLAPYVGLWSRLQSFEPGQLSELLESKEAVRIHLMRNTVHLVSADDALGWRPLFSPLQAAEFRAHFGVLDGVDLDGMLQQATELLTEKPTTRAALGRSLATSWPGPEPAVLAYAVTHHLPVCQIPPRGVWGRSGSSTWALVEQWLGRPLRPVPVEQLILRYLGAFGPATVADVQLWSGLSRLQEVIEGLDLVRFRNESGQTLYDLPQAPRPPADAPAPPRFLPAYDNLLLSHQDRSRVIPDGRAVPLPAGNGASVGTFLVDGSWQGYWQFRDGAIDLEPFSTLPRADRDELRAEADRLVTFLGTTAGGRPQP